LKRSLTRTACTLAAAGSFLALACAALLAASPPAPPEVVTIGSKLWAERKFKDVTFSHQKHAREYKIACAECHHVYKDGKNVWTEGQEVQPCDACHTFVKTGKDLAAATPEEKKLSLWNAFHDDCKGCHTKYNKEKGTQAATVKCLDCHPKK